MNDLLIIISCLLVILGAPWLGWRSGRGNAYYSIYLLPGFSGSIVAGSLPFPVNLAMMAAWGVLFSITLYLGTKHEKRLREESLAALRRSPSTRKFMDEMDEQLRRELSQLPRPSMYGEDES